MLPHTEREALPKIILRRNVFNLRKDSKPSKEKKRLEHANGLEDTNTKHFSKSDLYSSKEHSPLPTDFYEEIKLNTFNNHLQGGI